MGGGPPGASPLLGAAAEQAGGAQAKTAELEALEGELHEEREVASETKKERLVPSASDTQPHETWHLQLVDFEIGWGHRLLGFSDHVNLVSGLIYGGIIISVCAVMLFCLGLKASSEETGGTFPHAARWFVFFLNLQLFLYVMLVFTKMPKLCYIQKYYYPQLDYNCTLLRYLQVEHALMVIGIFSFAIWTFSSYAYVLTFGDSSKADKPDFTHQLETMLNMDDIHAAEHRMGLETYSRDAERRLFSGLAGTERYLRAGLPAGGAAALPLSQASTAPGLGAAYRPAGSAPAPSAGSRPSAAARPASVHPAAR
ncbi:unnamed protein product [Prorocentrum cordatum]|uniref:Protein S-acyltransferase n=1 Tax=Prorocentrum cordatum TaxID=2364126 RepID=A0ABN9XDZ7_9DINO|nr:unnamed protein product [Polarella glacialis]